MRHPRRGFTLLEALVVVVLLFVVVGGGMLWMRLEKLNSWAVAHDAWARDELYKWVKTNSFAKGSGTGDPDPTKPPPPPEGL